ncbi:C39 family peptidase [Methanosarcina sp. UBA289]|uniref:C39 family peptidase n=1 Tax=Methanosarcina sp. UBA289 TaxID=1915574 RepID=UPI0025E671CE|nr:C39 family peptidase [Methanosarcina sp. UBA289]
MGHSVQLVELDSKPFDAAEAMKKSIEIAKNEYPNGKIESTQLVVYDYPAIGAMTVVKDKTTGDEYRIFVDVYTLEVIPDKPATETEPGVWSMYDQILKSGKENNLKEWQKSDELAKSIEQAATNKGVNINAAVTEENIKKLSSDAIVLGSFTGKILDINGIGQERSVFCGPACIRMVCKYYNKPTPIPTQETIYMGDGLWSWNPDSPPYSSGLSPDDIVKWATYRWGKTGTIATSFSNSVAISEIENSRPFSSIIPNHF